MRRPLTRVVLLLVLAAANGRAYARPGEAPARDARPPAAPEPDEVGVDEGNGSGFGRGAGGLGPANLWAPAVIPTVVSVRGSLDREIVRRIVQRHFNEATYCYERELVDKRTLRGRVSLVFTISAQGVVVRARRRSSTLRAPRVESCLLAAVRRWEFPYPLAHDAVTVVYRYAFFPGGADYPLHPTDPRRAQPAPDK
jgi:TonB family protein